jgi:hypothetical protein
VLKRVSQLAKTEGRVVSVEVHSLEQIIGVELVPEDYVFYVVYVGSWNR